MNKYSNFIDGEFVPPRNSKYLTVINPVTETAVSEAPNSGREDVCMAVNAAFAAKREWSRLSSAEIAGYLRRLAALVKESRDSLARTITEELGKVLGAAEFEVAKCAQFMEFAAEWARRLEGEVVPSDSRGETILVLQQPRGVVTGIVPWNAPFMTIGRKVGPALITGNTIVLKPSSHTPNSAFEFAKLVEQAGIPKGVINVISGSGSVVGKELVRNPKVNFVSATGSVEMGQDVIRNSAENMARVSLELGGKAPTIVMNDADIDLAVTCTMASRGFGSTGQACICAERIYVQEKVAEEFLKRLISETGKIKVGNPLQPGIDMGSLVSREALERIESMVQEAVKEGAEVVVGGKRPTDIDKGFFYEPTILANLQQSMAIMQKEIFGPVFLFMTFKTLDEAIAMANDCEYGLSSAIFTRNIDSMMKAVNELEFGETYVNRPNGSATQGFHAGWKKSGIGGDDGRHGVYEYLQPHTAYIQTRIN